MKESCCFYLAQWNHFHFFFFFFLVGHLDSHSSFQILLDSRKPMEAQSWQVVILSLVLLPPGNHHQYPRPRTLSTSDISFNTRLPGPCSLSPPRIAQGECSCILTVPKPWGQQTAVLWKQGTFFPAVYRFPKSSLATGPDQLRSGGHAIGLEWVEIMAVLWDDTPVPQSQG